MRPALQTAGVGGAGSRRRSGGGALAGDGGFGTVMSGAGRHGSSASTAAALAAIWLASHPWAGVIHDGVIYAAQALSHVRPAIFGGDVFFASGSQDDYTVFGRLYGELTARIGLSEASRLLWGLSQVLWFAVALSWVRRTIPARWLLPAAALVFALPRYYSSDLILRVAEPFLTARSFAEPLTIACLLAFVLGRRVAGIMLLCAAAAVHPLMAMPGVVIAALLHLPHDSKSWCRFVLLPGAAAMAVVYLLLGAGVLSRIDEPWYETIRLWNPIVAVDEWRMVAWVRMLLPLCVLEASARVVGGSWGRVWRATAVCAAIGLGLSVFACWTRWELGIQVQPWRFGWIAVWAAPLAAVMAATTVAPGCATRSVVLLTAIPVTVLTMQEWASGVSLLAILYLCLLGAVEYAGGSENRMARRLATAFAAVLTLAALGFAVALYVAFSRMTDPVSLSDIPFRLLAGEQFGWFVLPALALAVRRLPGRTGSRTLVRLSVAAGLVVALMGIDGRSRADAALEDLIRSGLPGWSQVIPEDATVFWPEHGTQVWLALQRRNFVSPRQISGAVFSRETGMLVRRRMAAMGPIAGSDAGSSFRVRGPSLSATRSARSDLVAACIDPELDFVALPVDLGESAAPPYLDPATERHHFLYRCAEFRDGAAAGSSSSVRSD